MINGAEGAGLLPGSVPRCAAFARVIGSPIGSGDRVLCRLCCLSCFPIVHYQMIWILRLAPALMLQGLTAHYLIRSTFKVSDGQSILFHAAPAGLGRSRSSLPRPRALACW